VTSPVAPGCEPFSAAGGPEGVLVLHGFTGSPYSMRPLGESLANQGYTVEVPRLPGHGTSLEDLFDVRFEDWIGAVEAAYADLAARTSSVAAVGLSFGGGMSVWLAEHHPELVAIAVVNPAVGPIDPALRAAGRELLAAGETTFPGVANDIAMPDQDERGYDQVPLEAAESFMVGFEGIEADLDRVTCPVLVLTSRQDHVVATTNSELLAARAAGPVEHVWLEQSFHVATLDYDAPLIEAEVTRFLESAFGAR